MLVTRALESPVALVWLQTSLQVNALFNVLLIWYLAGWNLFSRLKKKKNEHVDENGDDPEWWGERDIREEGTNACYDGDTCASQLYTAILFKQQKRFLKKEAQVSEVEAPNVVMSKFYTFSSYKKVCTLHKCKILTKKNLLCFAAQIYWKGSF